MTHNGDDEGRRAFDMRVLHEEAAWEQGTVVPGKDVAARARTD